MKHLSHFKAKHVSFPHLSPIAQSLSANFRPTLSALVMKRSSKDCKILPIIVEIVLARMLLRTSSTHFIVKSMMDLSTLDRALNQTLVLIALDLIFTRSCLVVKAITLPSSHSVSFSGGDEVLHNLHEKSSIKGYFPNLTEQYSM